MKILITGGAGFIGSHLADRLIERGDQAFIVDNLITGKMENLQPKKLRSASHGFTDSFKGDANVWVRSVADQYIITSIFEDVKPDIVIHAAATGVNPNDWQEDIRSNVLGTANVVKSSICHKVKRFIYLQTSLCYGSPQWSPITLDHPLNPTGSYAITKTAAERFVLMSGLDYVSLRLANCYGPRNLTGPIPAFYKRLKEGQPCQVVDTRRDFIYIDDLVGLMLKAIDGTGSGIYHVASGRDYLIEDIYVTIRQVMEMDGMVPEIQPRGKDDVETILLDPSRTRKDFGFTPSVGLRQGIRKAVQWYETHGLGKVHTHLQGYDTQEA